MTQADQILKTTKFDPIYSVAAVHSVLPNHLS